MSVDVGPRVLDLAGLHEDGRNDAVQLRHQLEHFIVRQMLQSKFTLTSVSGVSLSQNSVAVARNHLSGLQQPPAVFFELFVGGVQPDVFDHFGKEHQDFLVGQPVERTGQAAHAGGERQVRVGQRRAHQVSGVSGNVAAFVVTEILNKVLILFSFE